jgi:transcription termination factor Rho
MSEDAKPEIVPGPLDLSEPIETPVKKPAARKPRASSKASTAKTTRAKKAPEKDEAPEASAEEVGSKEKPSSDDAPQKELLFSSDNEDQNDSSGTDSEAKASDVSESMGAGGEEKKQKDHPRQQNQNNRQKGGQKNFNNKGNQGNNQQLSNRKKKQMQWKAKQQQKKGKKERFKIDGLNADIDSTLELGDIAEWEVIRSQESLETFVNGLEIPSEADWFDFTEAYVLPLDELREKALATEKELPPAPSRRQFLDHLLAHAHDSKHQILLKGHLEILSDGHGLLTYGYDSYRLKAHCAFVPQFMIKQFGLLRGHELECQAIPAQQEATGPLVVKILKVQGLEPEKINEVIPFTEQIPYYPLDRIFLECDKQEKANKVSMRVVDLISPIGFGQRGIIVAPPRTGKTILLQGMANSIQFNYPEAHLIILLIDERPEEVTDFKRRIEGGEVVSSTFDENAESHVHAAEMVIEKSRRMVEAGKDVVILLDSITRLARAYNTVMPNSGKILSGASKRMHFKNQSAFSVQQETLRVEVV